MAHPCNPFYCNDDLLRLLYSLPSFNLLFTFLGTIRRWYLDMLHRIHCLVLLLPFHSSQLSSGCSNEVFIHQSCHEGQSVRGRKVAKDLLLDQLNPTIASVNRSDDDNRLSNAFCFEKLLWPFGSQQVNTEWNVNGRRKQKVSLLSSRIFLYYPICLYNRVSRHL